MRNRIVVEGPMMPASHLGISVMHLVLLLARTSHGYRIVHPRTSKTMAVTPLAYATHKEHLVPDEAKYEASDKEEPEEHAASMEQAVVVTVVSFIESDAW